MPGARQTRLTVIRTIAKSTSLGNHNTTGPNTVVSSKAGKSGTASTLTGVHAVMLVSLMVAARVNAQNVCSVDPGAAMHALLHRVLTATMYTPEMASLAMTRQPLANQRNSLTNLAHAVLAAAQRPHASRI